MKYFIIGDLNIGHNDWFTIQRDTINKFIIPTIKSKIEPNDIIH